MAQWRLVKGGPGRCWKGLDEVNIARRTGSLNKDGRKGRMPPGKMDSETGWQGGAQNLVHKLTLDPVPPGCGRAQLYK